MATIRSIVEADIAACVSFGIEALRPVFASFEEEYGADLFARMKPDWVVAQAEQIEAACRAATNDVWVADEAGVPVGIVSATRDRETGLGDINLLAVDPAHQRRGVAGRLLDAALEALRLAGLRYASAHLRDHAGHLPARRALANAGFTAMGLQPLTLMVRLDSWSPVGLPARTSIRPIDIGEAEDCVRFGIESFRPVFASFQSIYGQDLFDRLRPDWEDRQSEYIRSACTDKPTLVSITDGRISGFVVIEPDVFAGMGAIELLAVDPAHAGRGIGTALNHAALRWLEQAGMAYAIVSTADDASHGPARRSYEKVGFQPMPVQWHLMVTKLT